MKSSSFVLIKKINRFKALSINIFGFLCLSGFISADVRQVFAEEISSIDSSYLESKDELEDYILDTGDTLYIKFFNVPELSGLQTINENGEIYFDRTKYTYVRGLTIKEITELLEKRFKEFLVDPEIEIRIKTFKPIRVSLTGEVRSPGAMKFPAFTTSTGMVFNESREFNLYNLNLTTGDINQRKLKRESYSPKLGKQNLNSDFSGNVPNSIKRSNDYVTTLSNAILAAGGLTSYSDISKIEIIRDIPLGKGGGKKRAIINFLSYIEKSDPTYDIRLFDGDNIFIPRRKEKDSSIIPKSILSGLSPKFIKVSIAGKIENPGSVRIPIEGSLSDVMNLTGPRKPLSGRIYLIRYNKDGTLLRKNIQYSASATPGSPKNPYLVDDDLITVKNSILGRTSGTLKAITEPFVGIYATKEIVEQISGKEL